jgi:hypothetical protein
LRKIVGPVGLETPLSGLPQTSVAQAQVYCFYRKPAGGGPFLERSRSKNGGKGLLHRVVAHSTKASPAPSIGFKIINLDCVIGRRGITIQLPPSILAKLIILKPI